MKLIKEIVITNFKFFEESKKLEINGKNVLIYGENGSGKSTVFWALYTFFESSFKKKNDVTKYFDISSKENLINLFSKDKTNSSIKLVFVEQNDNTEFTKEISLQTVNTNTDNMIKEASYGSDFINHRLLSRMYDFRNSQDIDLFDIFQKDILKHIKIENTNLGDLWEEIEGGLDLNGNRRYTMTSQPYKEYENKVKNFNATLKHFIDDIIPEANKIIKEDFQESIKIDIKYENAIWNDFIPGVKKSRSYRLKKPQMIIKMNYYEDILASNSNIKPHIFLNEGKLTISFLALRLAIINRRASQTDIKVLVLDDLLLSLDMGYREEVINIILKKYSDFQIMIMTHDRYFYNKLCSSINCNSNEQKWIKYSFYEDKKDDGNPPKPFIAIEDKDELEWAKFYLRNHDYPASANYLRKSFEHLLCNLIPSNYLFNVKSSNKPSLNVLKSKYSFFCKNNAIPNEISLIPEFHNLVNKTDIMNSFSHYDIESPIYKKELEDGIKIIENMKKIRIIDLIQEEEIVELIFDQVGKWELSPTDKVLVMTNQDKYHLISIKFKLLSQDIKHASYTGSERHKIYTPEERNKGTKELYYILECINCDLKNNSVDIKLDYNNVLDYLYKDNLCLKYKILNSNSNNENNTKIINPENAAHDIVT